MILGFTIFAPFFITKPAPIYPPIMLQAAAASPTVKITSPFNKKIMSDVMLDVKLMILAWPFAVLILSLAKMVKAMIKKVPVPGP